MESDSTESCDTEWLLLLKMFFSFLPRALFEVFRVVRVGITGHTEHNADLLELGPGPGQQSELRTVLQPICLVLTKIAYRYSLGRGTGSALDKCNKETLCNYSMFCTILQERKVKYFFNFQNQIYCWNSSFLRRKYRQRQCLARVTLFGEFEQMKINLILD